jgi:hypothetical protein
LGENASGGEEVEIILQTAEAGAEGWVLATGECVAEGKVLGVPDARMEEEELEEKDLLPGAGWLVTGADGLLDG